MMKSLLVLSFLVFTTQVFAGDMALTPPTNFQKIYQALSVSEETLPSAGEPVYQKVCGPLQCTKSYFEPVGKTIYRCNLVVSDSTTSTKELYNSIKKVEVSEQFFGANWVGNELAQKVASLHYKKVENVSCAKIIFNGSDRSVKYFCKIDLR